MVPAQHNNHDMAWGEFAGEERGEEGREGECMQARDGERKREGNSSSPWSEELHSLSKAKQMEKSRRGSSPTISTLVGWWAGFSRNHKK